MNIYKLMVSFISIFAVCNICLAEDADLQAASFHQIYMSICGKSINDLDALRQKLSNVPEFPPEKAAGFLNGNAGSAWPIPDKTGLFVLALPDNKNICSIYARRASAEKVEEKFIEFVSTTPQPLLVKKISDTYIKTPNNGEVHKLEYVWFVENTNRKILFTLTTSKLETAQLQALGSVSMVSE